MTDEEARTVLEIMCGADGGCAECAGELMRTFANCFPEHTALASEIYVTIFKEMLPR